MGSAPNAVSVRRESPWPCSPWGIVRTRRRRPFSTAGRNLCRCTGYRPIVDIARALPPAVPDAGGRGRSRTGCGPKAALPLFYQRGGHRPLPDRSSRRAGLRGRPPEGMAVGRRPISACGDQTSSAAREDAVAGPPGRDCTGSSSAPTADHRRRRPLFGRLAEFLAARHPEFARPGAAHGRHPDAQSGNIGGNLGTASPIGNTMPALIAFGAAVDRGRARGPPRHGGGRLRHRLSDHRSGGPTN